MYVCPIPEDDDLKAMSGATDTSLTQTISTWIFISLQVRMLEGEDTHFICKCED